MQSIHRLLIRLLAYLLVHRAELATAFVLSGGLFCVYAWIRLTEVHTGVTEMFKEEESK